MTQTFLIDLNEGLNDSLAYFDKELRVLKLKTVDLFYATEKVVELAKEAYEYGKDFHGVDYLNQVLTPSEKRILKEMIGYNLTFEAMVDEVPKLLGRMNDFIKHLEEEVKIKLQKEVSYE